MLPAAFSALYLFENEGFGSLRAQQTLQKGKEKKRIEKGIEIARKEGF